MANEHREIDPAILLAMQGLPDDFADFSRIFQNEIRPVLADREAARLSAAATAKKATIAGIIIGAVGAVASLFLLKVPMLAVFAGVAGIAIHGIGRGGIGKIGKEAKSLIVLPVAKQFGLSFEERLDHVPTISDVHRVGLVPSWDRSSYEDRMTGQRNGVDFEFFEAHLEDKRQTTDSKGRTQTRWVTVFKGQCLRFDFHKAFHGRTLVTRDAGFFNRFGGGRGMQRAILESPEFEKAFEVYTTDQVEARFLLTPDFMQRLVDLENTFRGGRLRCAFENGEMFVALEGGDLFEPGSMFIPLDNPDRMRDLLNDFAAVFNLIDRVALKHDAGDERS